MYPFNQGKQTTASMLHHKNSNYIKSALTAAFGTIPSLLIYENTLGEKAKKARVCASTIAPTSIRRPWLSNSAGRKRVGRAPRVSATCVKAQRELKILPAASDSYWSWLLPAIYNNFSLANDAARPNGRKKEQKIMRASSTPPALFNARPRVAQTEARVCARS